MWAARCLDVARSIPGGIDRSAELHDAHGVDGVDIGLRLESRPADQKQRRLVVRMGSRFPRRRQNSVR